ncbi:rhomboid family intramembrane serine protease [Oceanihabitans sediminis]|uniref:Rhomboid family intramembrane serine protease n=1 Tax=Oceanihabitans sediminis TaxID=1812012 RepID=A0A368P1Q3_9FLAO|nr:rhomboid family intramembrane serine protease [Oceanihabitans sediminis]MDX1277952.1 rhomboid family intramembrane serine protease [Oceanihabitans sediminis]MDX1774139.1 rhomboid family intramembrane serine protease [Oceanihabitans sediminis]RBP30821.1 membrane associated rhomboid family serine protease [Oceanihabitans sediminis]RCU56787.1 rhomboid family intramembrane serine protease [Oceanihabitans sediminis]
MNRITDTVKHLIIINVIMFIGTMTIGGGQLFYDWFALYFPKNEAFQPWQIITHMFMHGGFTHLLFNMFALWMFGTAVEQVLGSKKFLFIYLSAGLGALLFQLGFYYFNYIPTFNELVNSGLTSEEIVRMVSSNQVTSQISDSQLANLKSIFPIYNASMVGASGCIMGVLAAFGMMNPEAKLMMIFLPIPIKAKYFIPGIILLDVVSALSGQSFFSPSNTAYMAHVGGAITGFLIMWYWKRNQFNQNRWD